MEFDMKVDCKCPKCGHEWEEETTIEIEKPDRG